MADKGESKSRGKGSPNKSPQKKSPTTPTSPVKKEVVTKSPPVSPIAESSKATTSSSSTMAEELRRAAQDEKVLLEEMVNVEEVAEGAAGEDEVGWSGWFTNTIASAKEKSNEMLQYLKQDFSEFTDTVSEAGRDLKDKLKLEENANKAVTVVGEKVNVVLEQMSTIFGVGPDDGDEEAFYVGSSGPLVVDRIQAKIYSLGLDEAVFLKDPEDLESYEKWLAHFDLEVKNDEIADLLTANPHLQLHYSQLVPEKVSHLVFWHRFYYRVQLIFDEEAQQKAKEKRDISDRDQSSSPDDVKDGASEIHTPGESGGGDQGMVEISEEDQKRLLAEYEEELKKGDESGKHSRRSSGTQLSSSSSGSFAIVTHDPDTNELKVDE